MPGRGLEQSVERGVLAGAAWACRHWLALVNAGLAVWLALPLLAPALLQAGYSAQANAIYRAYRIACHQLPYRSYFVGGPRLIYGEAEIAASTEVRPLADFTGSQSLGFKMGVCERDIATYAAVLLAGLTFAVGGRRFPLLPWRWFVVLLIPIIVDGLSQLTGLRESTWLLRTITGGLFGLAIAWLLYHPLADMLSKAEASFRQRLAALG